LEFHPSNFQLGQSPWCQAIAGTIFKLAFGPCVGVRFGRCGMSEVLRCCGARDEMSFGAKNVVETVKLLGEYGD